ncbi:hypothetical protein [Streptomyces sp. NPDC127112]|uniref:hypothetical protein n=1 Tax=Streptomyces sp. NPDC127112 TaxID=3345364 RepID=UPI00363596C8
MEYSIKFPENLDEFDWFEVENKGWLDGVRVSWEGHSCTLSFFDEIRLPQVIAVDIERLGYFASMNVIVVRRVTRDAVDQAVSLMASRGFVDLINIE